MFLNQIHDELFSLSYTDIEFRAPLSLQKKYLTRENSNVLKFQKEIYRMREMRCIFFLSYKIHFWFNFQKRSNIIFYLERFRLDVFRFFFPLLDFNFWFVQIIWKIYWKNQLMNIITTWPKFQYLTRTTSLRVIS